jgi:hypothetical protein
MYHFSFLPMITTPSLTVQDFQYQAQYRIRRRFSDVSKQKYLFLDCLTSHDECTTLARNAEIRSPTTQRHIPTAHRHSATSRQFTNGTGHIPTEMNPQQQLCENPKSRSQYDNPSNKTTNIKYRNTTSV